MPPRPLPRASEPAAGADSDDDGTSDLTDLLAKLTRAQQRQLAQKMAPAKGKPLRPLPPQKGQPPDSTGKQPVGARTMAARLELIVSRLGLRFSAENPHALIVQHLSAYGVWKTGQHHVEC